LVCWPFLLWSPYSVSHFWFFLRRWSSVFSNLIELKLSVLYGFGAMRSIERLPQVMCLCGQSFPLNRCRISKSRLSALLMNCTVLRQELVCVKKSWFCQWNCSYSSNTYSYSVFNQIFKVDLNESILSLLFNCKPTLMTTYNDSSLLLYWYFLNANPTQTTIIHY